MYIGYLINLTVRNCTNGNNAEKLTTELYNIKHPLASPCKLKHMKKICVVSLSQDFCLSAYTSGSSQTKCNTIILLLHKAVSYN
jgi:hypothetical protein